MLFFTFCHEIPPRSTVLLLRRSSCWLSRSRGIISRGNSGVNSGGMAHVVLLATDWAEAARVGIVMVSGVRRQARQTHAHLAVGGGKVGCCMLPGAAAWPVRCSNRDYTYRCTRFTSLNWLGNGTHSRVHRSHVRRSCVSS